MNKLRMNKFGEGGGLFIEGSTKRKIKGEGHKIKRNAKTN